MSKQQFVQGGNHGDNSADESAVDAGQAQLNTSGTDDILDEIDALLDTNAEEFVRSFVQKGGQ
ncbi:ubiquitin-like protein Pup [Corynebacterium gottingense]|nr:ubiquitin-like protein Pup [Corynebacterium gottingense]